MPSFIGTRAHTRPNTEALTSKCGEPVFGRDYLVTYFIIFPENSNSRLKQLAFAPSEGAP